MFEKLIKEYKYEYDNTVKMIERVMIKEIMSLKVVFSIKGNFKDPQKHREMLNKVK